MCSRSREVWRQQRSLCDFFQIQIQNFYSTKKRKMFLSLTFLETFFAQIIPLRKERPELRCMHGEILNNFTINIRKNINLLQYSKVSSLREKQPIKGETRLLIYLFISLKANKQKVQLSQSYSFLPFLFTSICLILQQFLSPSLTAHTPDVVFS